MFNDLYLEFAKKNYIVLAINFILNISITIDKIGLPHYYGKLISSLKSGKTNSIKKLFLILIVFWSLVQILNLLRESVYSKIFPRFVAFIRNELINRVFESNKANYQDLETGKLLTKLSSAPGILYGIAKEIRNIFLKNFFTYISTFFYLFTYDKFIGLVYIICIVAIVFVVYVYVHTCKKYVRESEEVYVDFNEQIDDTMNNLMSIYTSSQIKNEKKRVDRFNQSSTQKDAELILYNVRYKSIFAVTFIIIFIFLNYVSFKAYLDKRVKLDTLVSIVIINYSLLQQLMHIFYDIKDFMNYRERIKLLDEYLDSFPKPKKHSRLANQKTNEVFKPDFCKVEFKNVSFSYQKTPLFKNFNLVIEPKDKVGLIGKIGSGKSTLVKLLVGLKSDYSGQILINGKDINTLNIDKLRKYISYIPQHPKLFDRTLYENIVYGLEDNTPHENQIYDILEKANLHDVATKFKKIMHDKVGKNGNKISGGQRQLVWLIRSLLKDTKMIILDEPTSSLDDYNSQKVITLIEELSKKRNIILITHDRNVLQNMNRIIELEKGKIIKDEKVR